MYWEFVINYLLIHYNVRNEDLLIKFVSLKRETENITKDKDLHKNFMWVAPYKATYYRRLYKTDK